MRLFRGALGATLLAQMALCPRLWTAARAFPIVPAFEGLPEPPSVVTLALTGLLVLSVLAASCLPKPRFAPYAVVLLGASLVLFDLNRLQPWFYGSLLLFLALGTGKDEESAWSPCALVLAATYVWSGLQKANLAFSENVFPWLLHPLGLDALRPLWPLASVLETSVGLLILFPKTRNYGLGLGVGMHAFLLLALGPLGQNANSVVWPWSFGMPILLLALFFRDPRTIPRKAVLSPVAIIAGVLPALNFVGLWDDNLSDALYSGRTRQAFVILTEAGAARLSPEVRPYVQRRPDRIGLDLSRWSLAETNVPPYPEIRAYRAVAKRLGVPPGEMTLIVAERPGIGETKTIFRRVP